VISKGVFFLVLAIILVSVIIWIFKQVIIFEKHENQPSLRMRAMIVKNEINEE
jgi:hypothetical protein